MRPSKPSNERGFILVTAVMFVLILTILGASLLSHGPAENSLVIDNGSRTQAFYYAESGLRRAVELIGSVNNLSEFNALRSDAGLSVNTSKVPLIRAYQYNQGASTPRDSVGTLESDPALNGKLVLVATGKSSGTGGFGTEYRTVSQTFTFTVNPLWLGRGVVNLFGSGFNLQKDDTLVGKIRVSNAADSATLVNYNRGPAISPDSVSVAALTMPDFQTFIAKKIAGGYQTITSGDIAGSGPGNPLVLGQGNNGIYYAPAGFSVPGGQTGVLKLYGTVYLLSEGPMAWPKEVDFIAGNGSASLVMIADAPGGTGLDFSKAANSGNIPVLMMTNGDVNFKKESDLSATSIFGNSIGLAKGQYFAYNHAKMDPFLDQLVNTPGGVPGGAGSPNFRTITSTTAWAEVTPPITQ